MQFQMQYLWMVLGGIQDRIRKEERGAVQVTVTRYVCEQCGTVWDYENNKQNQHAGWSVVGRV